jgi:hypothetical protein
VILIVIGVLTSLVVKGLSVGSVGAYLTISGALSLVLTVLLTPFIVAVIAMIYIDLRVRKEAFDIELLSDAQGAAAPAPAIGSVAPEPAIPSDAGRIVPSDSGLPHPGEQSSPFGE